MFSSAMNKSNLLPIRPGACPVFYGYVIVLVGSIGGWASLPGQTVGVSTFTDPVMQALSLTRDQFSWAYMLGTLLSSLILTQTGILYDRRGATFTGSLAAALLGITLLLCSFSDVIALWIITLIGISHWLVPFFLMILLFFMLRFSGQGVLTMVSRNMIMKWFDRYRGRVNAISSVSISLGFSASPVFIDMLIQGYGWSGAWQVMAACMAVILTMIIVFYKDNPEEYGLAADGLLPGTAATRRWEKTGPSSSPDKSGQLSFTLAEATRTRAFWMYALTLSFYSFFVTGLTFHVVSIFGSAGYSRTEAIGIFLPISVVSVIASLIANFISDWIRLKILLYAMITGAFSASIGLAGLNHGWGIYLIIVGGGLTGGLFATLMTIVWPRFFGRKHLGAISGKAMSMLVLASALGPVFFSLSNTWLQSYTGVALICMVFLSAMAVGSLKADVPMKP